MSTLIDSSSQAVYVENSNNPSYPNYRPSAWQRPLERWQQTQEWFGDIWNIEILRKYLIQKPGEFKQDFETRLQECCPDERFKQAVEDNAAILNQFEVNEQTYQGFIDAQDNIDIRGKSLKSWDYEMKQRFFRDGVVAVVVDHPKREVDQPSPARPSLTWVPVTDLYAPAYATIAGISTLVRLSIRRDREELVSTGQTESMQIVSRYFEYQLISNDDPTSPLACTVTVWKEQKTDVGTEFIEEDSTTLYGANGRPLQRLPIEILSVTKGLEFNKEDDPIPPLYSLLKLVIKFTNHESQNDAFEGKVMIPTINEYLEHGDIDSSQPLYSGPSRTNIRGVNDRIEVMEPRGSSAALVYEHQDKRDERISKLDNKFFHLKGGPVTATEAAIENLKSTIKLPALIEMVLSFYQEIIKIWRIFSDPSYNGSDYSGGITVSDRAMQSPTDQQDIRNTFEGVTLGIISPQVALQRLLRLGWLEKTEFEQAPVTPNVTDPDEVLS